MQFSYSHQLRELPYQIDQVIDLYKRYAEPTQSFIFEYNNAGNKTMPPRFSVIGLSTLASIRVKNNALVLKTSQEDTHYPIEDATQVWPTLEQLLNEFDINTPAHLPCFSGGWFGFWGYESVRYFEPQKLPFPNKQDLTDSADIALMLPKQLLILDHQQARMWLVSYAPKGALADLELTANGFDWLADCTTGDVRYQFDKQYFMQAVEQLKQHITDGEIMQAVLSQRMCIDVSGQGIDFFAKLRKASPSPYAFYVRMDNSCIFGASPETLVRSHDGQIVSFPMAGTRHRTSCEQTNQRLEAELLNDEKECAEHLMLIDLARNDVGKVAKLASVSVPKMMSVEHFSHVMHITSEVRAEQLAHTSALDVIRATLPAGTLSGAPKIRAMQLIDQYETVRRGLYGGGVGVLSEQNVDLAIVIRSALIKDGCLHIQAGAGVVADSVAVNEWQETLNKSRAMLEALGIEETKKDKEESTCY
ncbi:anthranilate synthase component I family protein [Pseudoalteromonas sp. S16_S37]|uniref:anthranilate synthase component I family protein n=1 Tax=Pseudoalteromonas sp. S16_S37 TaxID=2720228 RepID=UPI00168013E5|nr:anthranilate synthase component I family protein [Pseudoalteromonas sp. S16_S37]MBD1581855.1 anthranilate synthase component I family protein [Pseudoalteromonas sp. S16_S37]